MYMYIYIYVFYVLYVYDIIFILYLYNDWYTDYKWSPETSPTHQVDVELENPFAEADLWLSVSSLGGWCSMNGFGPCWFCYELSDIEVQFSGGIGWYKPPGHDAASKDGLILAADLIIPVLFSLKEIRQSETWSRYQSNSSCRWQCYGIFHSIFRWWAGCRMQNFPWPWESAPVAMQRSTLQ